jgi:hypothetical protein
MGKAAGRKDLGQKITDRGDGLSDAVGINAHPNMS